MPAYDAAIPRPPRTLTELERATLRKVTGEHRAGTGTGSSAPWRSAPAGKRVI